jgi:hypothetical protein
MNQGLIGSPKKECADDIGISDVGQLIALLEETLDVVTEGLIVIIDAAGLAGKPIVLKPKTEVRFLGVLEDVCRCAVPLWERCAEDVFGKSLRPRRWGLRLRSLLAL